MWVGPSVNRSPPFVRVRLPPAAIVIEPSTVYTIPEQTCGVEMTQFPTMAGPVWSHVCAAAGDAKRDRAPTRLPMAGRTTTKKPTGRPGRRGPGGHAQHPHTPP